MTALFFAGAFGLLGTAGALECGVISIARFMVQATICGAVAVYAFNHSDLRA